MAFSYGDTPRACPVTYLMDREYMERRWQAIVDAGYVMMTIEASIVSCGDAVREALAVFPAAWRYDIGEQRIEMLFDPGFDQRQRFIEDTGCVIVSNRQP